MQCKGVTSPRAGSAKRYRRDDDATPRLVPFPRCQTASRRYRWCSRAGAAGQSRRQCSRSRSRSRRRVRRTASDVPTSHGKTALPHGRD